MNFLLVTASDFRNNFRGSYFNNHTVVSTNSLFLSLHRVENSFFERITKFQNNDGAKGAQPFRRKQYTQTTLLAESLIKVTKIVKYLIKIATHRLTTGSRK